MIKRNLSGRDWWEANQRNYPNSSAVDDLEPGFRTRVVDFIKALRDAQATVRISSTRRNAVRAHLMHYSWKVAHGMIKPDDVPPISGLDIEWNHGDADRSKDAAMEMVHLFGMVHIAALRSNHITGRAIDMDIRWKDKLMLSMPLACGLYEIDSKPRTGDNLDLHTAGAQHYQVRKLRSDPPHWSADGK